MSVTETAGKVFYNILVDKVRNEELILLEHFLQKGKLARNIPGYDIIKNKLKPLADVHFEQIVMPDQLTIDVVKSVV